MHKNVLNILAVAKLSLHIKQISYVIKIKKLSIIWFQLASLFGEMVPLDNHVLIGL